MSAPILERGQWVDKSIDLYIGTLVEYDMRDGGLSIIKEYNVVLDNNDLPKGMRSSMESDLEWLEVESAYKTKQRLL